MAREWAWPGIGFAAVLGFATLTTSELLAQTAAQPEAASAASPLKVGVNLNITPKRLTFSRGQRSATVYIFNQGNTAATFDISMIDRVMLPNGDIRAASEADVKPVADKLNSAKAMVLATPRRATLGPGKGQTIRIRITPAAGAQASEYRSHLLVQTVPSRDVGLTAENAAVQGSNQFSFRVTAVFGISIPVIIRSGPADIRAEIRSPKLTYVDLSPDGVAPARRTPVLAFDIGRTGTNSLFGNVEIRSKGREKDPIGLVRGLGLYTEIDHRSIQIPLKRAPAPGEQLEIAFVDDDVTPGRVIARSSLKVP